ncbi:MAG: hypothetical protein GAK29_01775 [Acinetobacter bereziniae]|uniref:DUF4882 domain-containing protein n=1 Tax=Acinetobacter bereziniae TaxID=106648 RepID=A0A833UQ26_ACIBZ|nr:MAG: hypothetical protein GAK29_01775 [Acinetobacter bereziniae]
MKKLTIALLTGLMSASGWSACTYNFDATQQDLQRFNVDVFPIISNAKVSYTTTLQDKVFMALSKNLFNQVVNSSDPSNALLYVNGDKVISSNAIQAFEFKLKLPTIIEEGSLFNVFPIVAGGEMENGKNIFVVITYQASGSRKSLFVTIRHIDDLQGSSFQLQPQNTLDGYQNIGVYLNQNTRQVGITFNKENKGYIYSYPSKLKNMYFTISSSSYGMTNTDINKEFSAELVTDATKMTQTYPTGTKDICGNTI